MQTRSVITPEFCDEQSIDGSISIDEGLLLGQLDGGISDGSDVYEKEYPIIEAAHEKAFDEMACFSDSTPINPTVFDWDAKIRSNLTEAVRAEMRRGKVHTKSIQ